MGTTASAHVVMPAPQDFGSLVFNEAFCLALAKAVGLSTTDFGLT